MEKLHYLCSVARSSYVNIFRSCRTQCVLLISLFFFMECSGQEKPTKSQEPHITNQDTFTSLKLIQ